MSTTEIKMYLVVHAVQGLHGVTQHAHPVRVEEPAAVLVLFGVVGLGNYLPMSRVLHCYYCCCCLLICCKPISLVLLLLAFSKF
jgi:hypothetical protein